MIVDQEIRVKWHGGTREHYEGLGYKYTEKDSEFVVQAYELTRGSNVEVIYECDYCGALGRKRFDSLMKSRNIVDKDCCAGCAPEKHNDVLLMIYGSLKSEFPKIAEEWCKYENGIGSEKITPSSGKKGTWKCSKGHKWVTSIYSRTGGNTGCPMCSESRGEQKVAETLDHLGVKYYREVSYSNLSGVGGGLLRFDFSLLNDNGYIAALIEYDGEYHFKKLFDGDGHERIVLNDKAKQEYCAVNKLPLYRIPYTEYDKVPEIIEQICVEELGVGT